MRRSTKDIAKAVTTEKYRSPTYFRNPPFWHGRARKIWIGLTLILILWVTLSCLGTAFLDLPIPSFLTETILSNGPLSPSHAHLAKDCKACHTESLSRVPDTACFKCHEKTIEADKEGHAFHAEHQAASMSFCSGCHLEHAGSVPLAQIDDRHCTVCHADLGEDTGRRAAVFDGSLSSHPEFAIHKEPAGVNQHLKFPHDIHLKAEGVLSSATGEDPVYKVLDCASCHLPEEDGFGMKPIVYENHCAVCHAHRIHPMKKGEAPHDNPEKIRGFLLYYFYNFPEETEEFNPRRGRFLDEKDFEKSVRLAVDREESILYRSGRARCEQCHELGGETPSTIENLPAIPIVVSPEIPDLWFHHSFFSHAAHSDMECTKCHTGAATSKQSVDILIPKMEACGECHHPNKVASSCTLCHTFHPEQAFSRLLSQAMETERETGAAVSEQTPGGPSS